MTETQGQSTVPRSIRQKQILDVASEQPDASLEEIASSIPGIDADLVDEVLEEYGDPAERATEMESQDNGQSEEVKIEMTDSGEDNLDNGQSEDVEIETPDPSELTEKQLEILQAIHEHPEAKQRELANILDISAPTVCNRANSIPGFEWEYRKEFTDTVLREELLASPKTSPDSGPDERLELEPMLERLRSLEETIEEVTVPDQSCPLFEDRELTLKIVRACIKSESITEEEELQIINVLSR